ncbi:Predicted DNA-binding transcriptional regulator YafY, contains an HTH and WYL domains [Streptomyces zhaozhouensis]|uniref:Predicted DNA-binding transcriptional regulator YafY, contains an HTH and WYL domains n=1 Tax=Streptomyces zhaozhouensis TaxID=1300267 RepID=A0A286E5D2_9ACTN|nr:WYL domain-containing protein [Streptomyces zhaozhouensis]SOD66117.1 Predicted DNA-binding transcriptional regulator YafY, contains an HTH and WYL domains [Streptomyces zhaozhouensis]
MELRPSARLLRLLSLLQDGGERSGRELAERLGVTVRTVRRDIERLRALDYPVHAARGTAGYRLGTGASLPPLRLDDEEAVAVAVGLRTTAGSSVRGIEESAVRALARLEEMLPPRLRHRVATLGAATVHVGAAGPEVAPETLMALAAAIRRRERLRCDYTDAHGRTAAREIDPHHLVSFVRHWYLLGWDPGRADWRVFRVDRLTPGPAVARFSRRALPDGDDPAAYLTRRLSERAWPHRATVALHGSAEEMAGRVWPGMGALEAVDEHSCLLHVGAGDVPDLVWMITSVNVDFTLVEGSAELAAALRAQAARCARAVARVPAG